MKNQKPNFALVARFCPSTPQDRAFGSRRPTEALKPVLNLSLGLHSMDEVAPGSRFSWLEVSHG